jgi:hypothetical protein
MIEFYVNVRADDLRLDDDDAFLQLHLTLHFEVSDATARLGSGERWCSRPDDVEAFRESIAQSPPTAYVSQARPTRVRATR